MKRRRYFVRGAAAEMHVERMWRVRMKRQTLVNVEQAAVFDCIEVGKLRRLSLVSSEEVVFECDVVVVEVRRVRQDVSGIDVCV